MILAIERDLDNDPTAVDAVIKDLREDGKINSQPKILANTIGIIYGEATPKQIASTIRGGPGNSDSVVSGSLA